MLAANPAKRVQDAFEPQVRPQVIHMPVRPRRLLRVVRDAGAHASRSQRAAYVNVETAAQFERAKFADLDQPVSGTREDQSVSSAFRFHERAR
jgi:hypothetical protein